MTDEREVLYTRNLDLVIVLYSMLIFYPVERICHIQIAFSMCGVEDIAAQDKRWRFWRVCPHKDITLCRDISGTKMKLP